MNHESLYLRKLNIAEIISVYYSSLCKSFPRNERRPLLLLLKILIKGQYVCLGAFENKEIVGYAFFVKFKNSYMWDYFAVIEKYRNDGVGTVILKKIMEYYRDAESVIGEVENPEAAADETERKLRERRLAFYYRNGCVDTTVRTVTFGVDFIIIRIAGKELPPERVGKEYLDYYRLTIPHWMFDDNVSVTKWGRS